MKEVEEIFDKLVKSNNIITKLKGTLDDYAANLEKEQIDVIYIHANHQYEAVKHHIETALKIKPKLAIGGHDYTSSFPGVVKAVREIFGQPNFTFEDTSWLVFLP
jgi:hypothetical protein